MTTRATSKAVTHKGPGAPADETAAALLDRHTRQLGIDPTGYPWFVRADGLARATGSNAAQWAAAALVAVALALPLVPPATGNVLMDDGWSPPSGLHWYNTPGFKLTRGFAGGGPLIDLGTAAAPTENIVFTDVRLDTADLPGQYVVGVMRNAVWRRPLIDKIYATPADEEDSEYASEASGQAFIVSGWDVEFDRPRCKFASPYYGAAFFRMAWGDNFIVHDLVGASGDDGVQMLAASSATGLENNRDFYRCGYDGVTLDSAAAKYAIFAISSARSSSGVHCFARRMRGRPKSKAFAQTAGGSKPWEAVCGWTGTQRIVGLLDTAGKPQNTPFGKNLNNPNEVIEFLGGPGGTLALVGIGTQTTGTTTLTWTVTGTDGLGRQLVTIATDGPTGMNTKFAKHHVVTQNSKSGTNGKVHVRLTVTPTASLATGVVVAGTATGGVVTGQALVNWPTLIFDDAGQAADTVIDTPFWVRRDDPGVWVGFEADGRWDMRDSRADRVPVDLYGRNRGCTHDFHFINNKALLMTMYGGGEGYNTGLTWDTPPTAENGRPPIQIKDCKDTLIRLHGPAAVNRATVRFGAVELDEESEQDNYVAYAERVTVTGSGLMIPATKVFFNIDAGVPIIRDFVFTGEGWAASIAAGITAVVAGADLRGLPGAGFSSKFIGDGTIIDGGGNLY